MHGPLNVKDRSSLRKPCACATSRTTNPAWGDRRLKPALRSDRLATICTFLITTYLHPYDQQRLLSYAILIGSEIWASYNSVVED